MRLADRQAQACGGQAGRQRVDRHDPAGVEDLRVLADGLELRVVEGQPPAEMLDPARDHDLPADSQAALDEPAAEPGGVDAPGLVLQPGDRSLDPPPERRFHPYVRDPDASRHDRPVLGPHQVAEVAHLAQVVVAARQVEEQVADGVEAEPDPGPAEDRPGRQPGPRQRGREQGHRIGRDRCGSRCPGHAIRPRSGTGSTAGRRAEPRPRRPGGPSRSGAPSPRPRPDRHHRRRTA